MRRWSFTVIVAAAALMAPLSAQKQGQLFLSLTSPDGKPIDGLKVDEVTITEDGTACKTVKVEPINWPTKVQVLVDNGRSNTNPINPLREGLKDFFMQMPDGVELSLYATASTPRPIVKPTTDKQKLVDAISLIPPDNGAGQFFDALLEASERVDKDKMPHFPVIVMIGSDFGAMRALDRDFQKLQMNVFNHGITTHVLLNVTSQGGTSGGGQVDLGLTITKVSGGRYESFNGTTRLATLLPEIGKQVAQSIALQSHQYRVTYERPAKANERAAIGAEVKHDGSVRLSLHGNY
jgi:VWA domain-containing protein